MNNDAHICLINGLGDRLLDFIGFYVLCKTLNYKPNISFTNKFSEWGNYDEKLFSFEDDILTKDYTNNKFNFFIEDNVPSASLCPYKVYKFSKIFLPDITFQEISLRYNLYSKIIIRPSEIIKEKIPIGLEKSYGIHLRKSDKVGNGDIRHISSTNEFQIIINNLLDDLTNIILSECEPSFLLVSEDEQWKNEFHDKLQTIAFNNNKTIQIVFIDYTTENNYENYKSVLDMFCLSRCKKIFQGIKYSTFSLLAGLLGNCKLVNYSKNLDSYDDCLIHNWNSVLEINNIETFDENFFEKKALPIKDITTNINSYFHENFSLNTVFNINNSTVQNEQISIQLVDNIKLYLVNNVNRYSFSHNTLCDWNVGTVYFSEKTCENVYFIIETFLHNAFSNWLYESAIYLETFNKLKLIYPSIKLLLNNKSLFKTLFLNFFTISEKDVFYKDEFKSNEANLCIFPSPVSALNIQNYNFVSVNHPLINKLFFKIDENVDRNNISIKHNFALIPKNKEIFFLNDIPVTFTKIKNYFQENMLDLIIINDKEICDLKHKIELVNSCENIILTDGSPFLVNGMFIKNKNIHVVSELCTEGEIKWRPNVRLILDNIRIFNNNKYFYYESEEKFIEKYFKSSV
jgi:hypothetical protein